ncbi:hypothetical protein TELCIR_16545 [Teladorsagia circumcincta]|uniref:Uncharacterized protein n=1 Tax=Teladorsagia circumcincta TaxID=45464 RepID=A0A2G9TV68_TELCI|nr:hypothetical protein TELCIR_16545 [Teladorsagia circumcincta]
MVARRRFSYENIDGVGDDASSDSRGRTDHDSTDEISKNEESSFDEFNGDGESSQHTDVVGIPSDDDCAGSRPLLEDDALDDDEEPNAIDPLKWHEYEQTAVMGYREPNIALNMAVQQPPILTCGFAPATLPRQSTPLTAAPRFAVKPSVAIESSISCISQPPPVTSVRPTQPVQHPALQQSSITKQVSVILIKKSKKKTCLLC